MLKKNFYRGNKRHSKRDEEEIQDKFLQNILKGKDKDSSEYKDILKVFQEMSDRMSELRISHSKQSQQLQDQLNQTDRRVGVMRFDYDELCSKYEEEKTRCEELRNQNDIKEKLLKKKRKRIKELRKIVKRNDKEIGSLKVDLQKKQQECEIMKQENDSLFNHQFDRMTIDDVDIIESKLDKTLQKVREAKMSKVRSVNESYYCVVCLESPRNTVLLECGHVVVCEKCSIKVQKCPVCQKEISKILKIYVP